MTTRFQIGLADSRDDAALRQRMAEDRMQGNITLSFRREPNYFLGCAVQGQRSQILKCTDTHNGRLVGLGARHGTTLFINGVKREVGYLSDLRADRAVRRGTLLARGYAYLRALHDANPLPLYFSVILDGNDEAIAALTSGRAGLPVYQDCGRVLTPAIHLDRQLPARNLEGISTRHGTAASMPLVFAFLERELAGKQFAPCYSSQDMGTQRLLGLKPEDFYLAYRGDEIVGCVAAWDQSEFRQTHVEGYATPLRLARPFYNALAKISVLRPLPPPGSKIRYIYLALIAAKNNSTELFDLLLRTVYRHRRAGDSRFMIAGLHERDPLSTVLEGYRRIEAGGRLFCIYYPDDAGFAASLDDRPPYVEMAAV